jgi:hypothetical protein
MLDQRSSRLHLTGSSAIDEFSCKRRLIGAQTRWRFLFRCWNDEHVEGFVGDHPMTEWNAADYERISGLQLAMAEEVLALLDLNGTHCILDIGCGNGKITAEIAAQVHTPRFLASIPRMR